MRDSGGTAFWHESYFMRGGMFSARRRLHIEDEATVAPPVPEEEYYKSES